MGISGVALARSRPLEALSGAFTAILRETPPHEPTAGTEETPLRAARAWLELTSGYHVDVPGLFKVFDGEGYDEVVALADIPFTSLCEHHLLPFVGECSIAYLPSDKIVGLSKLARVTDAYARRLQNQERMTSQIADALIEHLAPQGVLVWVEARHSCMTARGARAAGMMRTSVTRGGMRDNPALRDEALRLLGK